MSVATFQYNGFHSLCAAKELFIRISLAAFKEIFILK